MAFSEKSLQTMMFVGVNLFGGSGVCAPALSTTIQLSVCQVSDSGGTAQTTSAIYIYIYIHVYIYIYNYANLKGV